MLKSAQRLQFGALFRQLSCEAWASATDLSHQLQEAKTKLATFQEAKRPLSELEGLFADLGRHLLDDDLDFDSLGAILVRRVNFFSFVRNSIFRRTLSMAPLSYFPRTPAHGPLMRQWSMFTRASRSCAVPAASS